MKKLIAIIMTLALLLTFSACAQQEEESTHRRRRRTTKQTVETTVETMVETTAETEPEMTLDEFIALTKGIWIEEDSVTYMNQNERSFTALVFGEDYICAAWYPGEYDRPGTIDGFNVLEENVFEIPLIFKAGEHMGDYLPESSATVTITILEDGRLMAEYDSGYCMVLVYGGQDFEEANRTACGL